MILKIWDEQDHAWLYYDNIEKFKIVYPEEMKYYLGEVKLPERDEPEPDNNSIQNYYYDDRNKRKLLVRLGPSPDYDEGYITYQDRFLGIIEEVETYDRLGMINFQQNTYPSHNSDIMKNCGEKNFIFVKGLIAYLLNDEGKTIEKL